MRYYLEFDFLPRVTRGDGNVLLAEILNQREEFLAVFINKFYSTFTREGTPLQYKPEDFAIRVRKLEGNRTALYVRMPAPLPEDKIFCEGVIFTFLDDSGGEQAREEAISEVTYYTVERSFLGTSCIGGIGDNGNHINYGDAAQTVEENLMIAAGLSFGKE